MMMGLLCFFSLTSWLYDTGKMCLKFEEIVKKVESFRTKYYGKGTFLEGF